MEFAPSPEAIFLSTVFAIGALASLTRTLYDGSHITSRQCMASAMFGGFVSLGILAVYVGNISHVTSGDLKCIGLAAIIGLAGREQKQIIDVAWRSLMSRITGPAPSNGQQSTTLHGVTQTSLREKTGIKMNKKLNQTRNRNLYPLRHVTADVELCERVILG